MKRLTWTEWAALGVTWKRRRLSGGSKDGECDDHGRPTVWITGPENEWIDTGLCASDLNRLARASLAVAKAASR